MAGAAVRESVTVAGRVERARVARAFTAGVIGPDLPGAFVEDALADALAWLGTQPPLTGTRAGPAAVMRRGSRGPAA